MSLTPPFSRFGLVPDAQGMYDPAAEKDACGLAMVATLRGTAGHDIITAALDALRHLEHRGAVGSDAGTGDGAGIITQVPDAFLRAVAPFALPAAGAYAVGNAFLPVDPTSRSERQAPARAARGIRGPRGHRMARGARAPRRARHARACRHAGRAAALRAVRRDDLRRAAVSTASPSTA